MPTSRSAKKRLRQQERRRVRNRAIRSSLRTYVKRVRTALEENDAARAETEFRVTAKKLDQASAKGIIHKNTASRYKSRLQQAIRKAKQPAPAQA
jgi:small subunit ribosomal protein S20